MGDEMGLGKTIQLIAFLAGLHYSGRHRTSLVVAPVTTLRHWARELRQWYPRFRVIMLHSSARSRHGAPRHACTMRPRGGAEPARACAACAALCAGRVRNLDQLVAKAQRSGAGVVLAGYEGLRRHAGLLLPLDWGYVILDEGHRIRNPDAEITLLCKQVRLQASVRMHSTCASARCIRVGTPRHACRSAHRIG
jgi:DNA excision repair protein ERCC-6